MPDGSPEAEVRHIVADGRATRPAARQRYKEYINRLIPETPQREAAAVIGTPEARAASEAFIEDRGGAADDGPRRSA